MVFSQEGPERNRHGVLGVLSGEKLSPAKTADEFDSRRLHQRSVGVEAAYLVLNEEKPDRYRYGVLEGLIPWILGLDVDFNGPGRKHGPRLSRIWSASMLGGSVQLMKRLC